MQRLLRAVAATGVQSGYPNVTVAEEAIGGAIYALIYDRLRNGGAATLPEIAPLATYMALAPFLGAKRACAVANGGV